MVEPLLKQIPTDLFEREMFSDVLAFPAQLKQMLKDVLKTLFSGDQAHFLHIIVAFLKTVDIKSFFQEKVEL